MKICLPLSVVALASGAIVADIDRQILVDKINSMPNITWTAAVSPRFKGQPLGASKSLLGVHLDQLNRLQAKMAAGRIVQYKIPQGFLLLLLCVGDLLYPVEGWLYNILANLTTGFRLPTTSTRKR